MEGDACGSQSYVVVLMREDLFIQYAVSLTELLFAHFAGAAFHHSAFSVVRITSERIV